MATRKTVRRVLAGRHVAAAYAVVVALYLVRYVQFQPLQIPAYLLVVAYDFVELALPAVSPYHPVGFPLFLYLLAVVGAAAARRAHDGAASDWTSAAGGVCLVVATLSLLFAAFVGGPLVSATDNPTPFAVTGATGVAFVLAGWWLLRGRTAELVPAVQGR